MKTRRAFIQTGAVALCGLAAAPALAPERDADWTGADVIIVGSNLAGSWRAPP
ncbi:MAG: twin-arginine translocation signal domain-containing protein [Bilophila wadsworthia]